MPDKKNLLIITHDLNIGGLQSVVVNICKEIDKNKFNVKVLCLRDLGIFYDELVNYGIEVSIIKQTEGTDYLSFLKIRKYIIENQIEIIHTHNTQPFIEGVIASLFTDVKTIVHTDHARIFPDKMRYMFAEWVASHFVYKVVAVSQDTLSNLHNYEKISMNKLCVIQNGIRKLDVDSSDKEYLKKQLFIKDSDYVLTFCGRFSEVKGVEYLIQAMPEIIAHINNTKLLLIGEGELNEKYTELINSNNLDHHITFLGVRTDVQQLLSVSNVLILPSLSEGLPMVILEAMSSESLIIASKVGGIPSVIRDKNNGLLFDSKCSKCIAEAVIYSYINREAVSKMKENALKEFEMNYSAVKMVSEYEKLYLRKYKN